MDQLQPARLERRSGYWRESGSRGIAHLYRLLA